MAIISIINTSFHLSISFLHIGKQGCEPGSGCFGRNHSKIELFSQYLFIILIILYQNVYYFDSNAERKKRKFDKVLFVNKIKTIWVFSWSPKLACTDTCPCDILASHVTSSSNAPFLVILSKDIF